MFLRHISRGCRHKLFYSKQCQTQYTKCRSQSSQDTSKVKDKTPDISQPVHEHTAFVETALKRLEDFRKYYTWRGKLILLTILAAAVTGGSYLYLYRDEMRDRMAEEVSSVASKSLEDDKLLSNAEQLSKEVLHNILHDDATKEITANFVADILTTSETKESATNLLLSVLQDQRVLDLTAFKLKMILLNILSAKDTREIVRLQIARILEDKEIKLAIEHLLSDVTKTPEVQAMLSKFFKNVLSSEEVTNQGTQLGRQITSNVISDKAVQQQAGEAIWSAVKYSVTPKILSPSKPSNNVSTEEQSNTDTD